MRTKKKPQTPPKTPKPQTPPKMSNPQMLQKEIMRERILETAYRVFSERTIDAVNLMDVAEAAGIGTATVYRYFNTKQNLVLEVSTWVWKNAIKTLGVWQNRSDTTAAKDVEFFLDSFITLYRENRNLMRFNQFFNVYVQRQNIPERVMKPYMDIIEALEKNFHEIYVKAEQDGTLRTEIPEKEMFSAMLHLMLAAVTRYAVGLVYNPGIDPERELVLLKDMLLRTYAR